MKGNLHYLLTRYQMEEEKNSDKSGNKRLMVKYIG